MFVYTWSIISADALENSATLPRQSWRFFVMTAFLPGKKHIVFLLRTFPHSLSLSLSPAHTHTLFSLFLSKLAIINIRVKLRLKRTGGRCKKNQPPNFVLPFKSKACWKTVDRSNIKSKLNIGAIEHKFFNDYPLTVLIRYLRLHCWAKTYCSSKKP